MKIIRIVARNAMKAAAVGLAKTGLQKAGEEAYAAGQKAYALHVAAGMDPKEAAKKAAMVMARAAGVAAKDAGKDLIKDAGKVFKG